MGGTDPTFNYWEALREIASIYKARAATVMPHKGEKGRIVEEIIKSAVEKVLPKRFSLGTGVIVSNRGEASGQTDIVVYDHFHNAPLLSEFSARIFPVEIVYAAVEVKSLLDKAKLTTSCQKIAQLRRMSANKQYVIPELKPQPDGCSRMEISRVSSNLAPRTYIAAFDTTALPKREIDIQNLVAETCRETGAHIHGLCLIDRDMLLWQKPYSNPIEIQCYAQQGFFYFLLSLLRHQQNFYMGQINLDAYLEDGSSPSNLTYLG